MIAWNDLRDWLKEVERIGELALITGEVDWDEGLRRHLFNRQEDRRAGATFRKGRGVPERKQGLE